jgi:hypothetical protein
MSFTKDQCTAKPLGKMVLFLSFDSGIEKNYREASFSWIIVKMESFSPLGTLSIPCCESPTEFAGISGLCNAMQVGRTKPSHPATVNS